MGLPRAIFAQKVDLGAALGEFRTGRAAERPKRQNRPYLFREIAARIR